MHWIIVDSIITHFLKLINPTCNLSQHISQDDWLPVTSLPKPPLSPFRRRLLFLYNEQNLQERLPLVLS